MVTQTATLTQVAIIGGGPAGALLACLLAREGIESVILELRNRDHVLGRIRAGVIEHGSAERLRDLDLTRRMDREGFVHEGVNLAFADTLLRIDFQGLVDKHVVIYGQTQLQKDLYDLIDATGITLIDVAEEIEISDVENGPVEIRYMRHGQEHTLVSDFVAGCDGAHGISRTYIPGSRQRNFQRTYPFVWVGVLSETPPVHDELIYANHETGFALCSMRNESLSRYYVQGSADDTVDDWPDERFWEVLTTRLPADVSGRLVTGTSIEKSITPLRSWVAEPMSFGRLFLAGDAAHIVPPTGAKGLNLAISDVIYLTEAMADWYRRSSGTGLDGYSDRALSRVWKAVRFSWWMTTMMHRFPGVSDDFDRKLQMAELEHLHGSENARRTMAESYVGLPL